MKSQPKVRTATLAEAISFEIRDSLCPCHEVLQQREGFNSLPTWQCRLDIKVCKVSDYSFHGFVWDIDHKSPFSSDPEVPDHVDADVILKASLTDAWDDARMSEVVRYLYGGTSLRLPEEWRPLFK